VFRRFRQAKFANGGSIFATVPAASENEALYESGLENNHLAILI
jgi:hypothetical protein